MHYRTDFALAEIHHRDVRQCQTILHPRWFDHLLKIHVLNLWYMGTGRAKNAKAIPFPIYGFFCLTTSHASMSPNFKYSKYIFMHSGCKMAKLYLRFFFFHWSTQHGRTIALLGGNLCEIFHQICFYARLSLWQR